MLSKVNKIEKTYSKGNTESPNDRVQLCQYLVSGLICIFWLYNIREFI